MSYLSMLCRTGCAHLYCNMYVRATLCKNIKVLLLLLLHESQLGLVQRRPSCLLPCCCQMLYLDHLGSTQVLDFWRFLHALTPSDALYWFVLVSSAFHFPCFCKTGNAVTRVRESALKINEYNMIADFGNMFQKAVGTCCWNMLEPCRQRLEIWLMNLATFWEWAMSSRDPMGQMFSTASWHETRHDQTSWNPRYPS